MTKKLIIIILLISASLFAEEYKLMFWNVENLFDIIDDPHKNDNEFTPNSYKKYTARAYQLKLENLTEIINDISPDIIGFAEVENFGTLTELSKLLKYQLFWKIILIECDDFRGIDVALMYRSDKFNLLDSISHKINLTSRRPTRDILEVVLETNSKNIFTVLVNHWPSRYGGQEKSEPHRITAAKTLKSIVKNIQTEIPDRDIIVMGDFNDTFSNKSFREIINAKKDFSDESFLIDILANKNKGTNYFHGEWSLLDHFLLNNNLNDNKSVNYKNNSAIIYKSDKLIEGKTKYFSGFPFRFYNINRINGGYSDHLPIVMVLKE
ncbi:MAG: hypothetical protein U9R41_03595 [Candidatus Marinimicrobia bacterium]|nr:hypothetical protein [Candidatus Neomarinimicrobiota bacterium]